MNTRTFRSVAWLLALFGRERFDIGSGSPYLTRWTLLGQRMGGELHYFHRSDYARAYHDHPWPFVSLILWPGYFENTPRPFGEGNARRWYGPLSILRRAARWEHWVEIPRDGHCWTLVYVGKKERSWGFWCPTAQGRKFVNWREHGAKEAAGQDGCA